MKSRARDQLALLVVALAFIVGLMSVEFTLDHRGISKQMSFFVVFNLLIIFAITWQGISLFRRTPRFWLSKGAGQSLTSV